MNTLPTSDAVLDALKTSDEWHKDPKYSDVKILDADGWDRSAWQFSFYEELITEDEFSRRLCMSTCQWPASRLAGLQIEGGGE